MIIQSFWQGKKVFITGHTGFKGSWLTLWLQSLGVDVKGYALSPLTTPSLFTEANIADEMESNIADIRCLPDLKKAMQQAKPEIVFHLAAQPLVLASYHDPVETYSTNVMGTVNTFEAIRSTPSVKAVINVTSDKCYKNREWTWGYREYEPMGGFDPYSNSKGCAELITSAYRSSFFAKQDVALASVRSGNVIGGGDWAKDRLIPDILSAFEKQETVVIRSPKSIRPWQHVLEALSGYLLLAQKLYDSPKEYAEGWNFGPHTSDAKPVEWILDNLTKAWPNSKWMLDKDKQPYEAKYLKLDTSKAKEKLGWEPVWSLGETLERIVNWQQAWLNQEDIKLICQQEIKDYMKDMQLYAKN